MVLPDGFVVPSLYYLVPLALLLVGFAAILLAINPPVTDRMILAFAPWMMLGATLHVLYKQAVVPPIVQPLFSSPTVYGTVAVLAGFFWILATFVYAAGLHGSIPRLVGVPGLAFVSVFAMISLMLGYEAGAFEPFWPVIAVVIAGVVAALAWIALSLWFTEVAATTGLTGAFVVLSQTLDGVTTAVGYDVLHAGEEVPLSLFILELGASLPTAEAIGAGWLFVLVKVSLSLFVVGLFADFLRDHPEQARLLLAVVAAVGLGPATHNLLLFTIS